MTAHQNTANKSRNSGIWYIAGAFIVIAVAAFFLLWPKKPSNRVQQFANEYAMDHFLRIQMEADDDAGAQLAASKYHDGQYATALKICDSLLVGDPGNADASKVAGIVALYLLDYDKAIRYFNQLGKQTSQYDNPGKFYEAIALLKRNQPGDAEAAEKMLKDVVNKDLRGKKEAEEWLR